MFHVKEGKASAPGFQPLRRRILKKSESVRMILQLFNINGSLHCASEWATYDSCAKLQSLCAVRIDCRTFLRVNENVFLRGLDLSPSHGTYSFGVALCEPHGEEAR